MPPRLPPASPHPPRGCTPAAQRACPRKPQGLAHRTVAFCTSNPCLQEKAAIEASMAKLKREGGALIRHIDKYTVRACRGVQPTKLELQLHRRCLLAGRQRCSCLAAESDVHRAQRHTGVHAGSVSPPPHPCSLMLSSICGRSGSTPTAPTGGPSLLPQFGLFSRQHCSCTVEHQRTACPVMLLGSAQVALMGWRRSTCLRSGPACCRPPPPCPYHARPVPLLQGGAVPGPPEGGAR